MNRLNQNDFLAFSRTNDDWVNAVIVAKLGTNRSGGAPGPRQPRERDAAPLTVWLAWCGHWRATEFSQS